MTVEELKMLCEKEIAKGNGERMIYFGNKDIRDYNYRSLKKGFAKAEVVKNTKDFIILG